MRCEFCQNDYDTLYHVGDSAFCEYCACEEYAAYDFFCKRCGDVLLSGNLYYRVHDDLYCTHCFKEDFGVNDLHVLD